MKDKKARLSCTKLLSDLLLSEAESSETQNIVIRDGKVFHQLIIETELASAKNLKLELDVHL